MSLRCRYTPEPPAGRRTTFRHRLILDRARRRTDGSLACRTKQWHHIGPAARCRDLSVRRSKPAAPCYVTLSSAASRTAVWSRFDGQAFACPFARYYNWSASAPKSSARKSAQNASRRAQLSDTFLLQGDVRRTAARFQAAGRDAGQRRDESLDGTARRVIGLRLLHHPAVMVWRQVDAIRNVKAEAHTKHEEPETEARSTDHEARRARRQTQSTKCQEPRTRNQEPNTKRRSPRTRPVRRANCAADWPRMELPSASVLGETDSLPPGTPRRPLTVTPENADRGSPRRGPRPRAAQRRALWNGTRSPGAVC